VQHRATLITIQMIARDSKLEKLRVVDNGLGMNPDTLEEAMQLRKKSYEASSLSYFGMGMKMASFSQAASMRVFSQSEDGEVSGAQMRRRDAGGQFNTEILEVDFAKTEYSSFRRESPGSGTVVEWQKIDDVSISKRKNDRVKWLNETVKSIHSHFGLAFHRFLERGSIRLFVEIWDSETQEVGGRTPSSPVDPFRFRSPIEGYPAAFYGRTPSKAQLELFCAIVPPGSDSENVKIHGSPLDQLGGFYVYRNDRLVQVAGWQDLTHKKAKDLQHSRIRIELTPELIEAGIKLASEKTSVKFSDDIKNTILASKSEQLGKTFEDYLSDVEQIKKQSSKRMTGLKPSLRVEGLENDALSSSVSRLIGFKGGSEHLEIISVPLEPDQVFELDLDNEELRINSLLFEEEGPLDSMTGYEFFKATLYFLLEEHFTKTALNKSTLLKIEQMHRVLAIALGIQELEDDEETGPTIPTPAVIASFAPIAVPSKLDSIPEELSDIQYQAAWSSVTTVNKKASLNSLAKGWRRAPETDPSANDPLQATSETESDVKLTTTALEADPDLAKLALEMLKAYKKSHDVASVSEALLKTENEVTAVLAQLVLEFTGTLDNRDEAFLLGEPFSASERDRLIVKFRDGQDLTRLSAETGRTCLQIAKEILDSPSFSAKISSSLLKRLGAASA
tara:strand:+ start:4473 stop:6500 length:2028 start_codon:yes stop_codon:yes gene_type:complete